MGSGIRAESNESAGSAYPKLAARRLKMLGTLTTAEEAHRSTSACILAYIAMKLGRKLRWDPAKEVFAGDAEANRMCSRPQRAPYGTEHWLKKA